MACRVVRHAAPPMAALRLLSVTWDPPIASTRTVVRRNLVIGSGRDGYRVAQHDRSALLVGNVARR